MITTEQIALSALCPLLIPLLITFDSTSNSLSEPAPSAEVIAPRETTQRFYTKSAAARV